MPAAAIALLLTAAVAHATWNYLAKGATGSIAFTFVFTALAQILYLPLAILAYVWTRQDLGAEAWGFVAVSGALNLVYFVLLLEGYRSGDLSLVYPLARGTGPAIAVAGGIIIFGERPSGLALAGAALPGRLHPRARRADARPRELRGSSPRDQHSYRRTARAAAARRSRRRPQDRWRACDRRRRLRARAGMTLCSVNRRGGRSDGRS